MRRMLVGFSVLLAAVPGIASAQSAALSVALTSDAFAQPAVAGEVLRLEASVSGGTPPYTYAWDLDGDGRIDRRSSAAVIEASFPSAGVLDVSVSVVDAFGAMGSRLRPLTLRGPRLRLEPVEPFFGPADLNPGDRGLVQFLRVTNVGDAVHPAGFAMFVPAPVGGGSSLRPAAVLPQSLIPVPDLEIGQTIQLMLTLNVAREAQCGQAISVDYLGTTWDGGHDVLPRRVLEKRVALSCSGPAAGPSVPVPGQPAIERRSGLYFNPARPGNGLVNFFRQVGTLGTVSSPVDRVEEVAGGWYTALPDRTPVWFTMQGQLVEGTGELTLRAFRNIDAPDGFNPVGSVAGRAWMGRLSATEVAFAWELNDGSTGIETMRTSEFELGGVNHTQTWFSPVESGWGLAIETLFVGEPFEFVGAFVYDASGAPRWVTGAIDSYAGGQIDLIGHRPHCPACPWIVDWSSDAVAAGSLQLEYAPSQTRASLDTSIVLPGAYPGEWMRSELQIQPVAAPVPVP